MITLEEMNQQRGELHREECLEEELYNKQHSLFFEGNKDVLTWVLVLCEEDYVLKLRRAQIEAAASMKDWSILSLSLSLSLIQTHEEAQWNARWWRKLQII